MFSNNTIQTVSCNDKTLPTNQSLNRKERRRNDMKATETVPEEDETESQMSYNVWDSPSNTYCDSALSSSKEVSKIGKVPENDEINFGDIKKETLVDMTPMMVNLAMRV